MSIPVKQQQLDTVPFHGHSILVLQQGETRYVAMKPICEAMGLDWHGQRQRLNRNPILSTCAVMITAQLPGDSQQRDIVFLPFDYLNGWLFTIDVTRVKPELQESILTYQRECYQALAKYFSRDSQLSAGTLNIALNQSKRQAEKLEHYWFARYPHWLTIRTYYYLGLPFKLIADRADKSAATCRRAVKSMTLRGLINPRYAAMHRLPVAKYELWLTANPTLGW